MGILEAQLQKCQHVNPGAVATTTRIDQNKSGFDLEYVKRNQKKQ